MFGGLALYYQGQLKLVLMENPGETTYRGRSYEYDIWNGLLVCTERSSHDSLLKQIPSLVPHPVLPKWLYLPFAREGWEDVAETLTRLVRGADPRIGVWPQEKKKGKSKKTLAGSGLGLGPKSEKALHSVGVKTLSALKKLGWKKAFLKLVKKYPDRLNLNMASGLIGACQGRDWRLIDKKSKDEARKLILELKKKRQVRKNRC